MKRDGDKLENVSDMVMFTDASVTLLVSDCALLGKRLHQFRCQGFHLLNGGNNNCFLGWLEEFKSRMWNIQSGVRRLLKGTGCHITVVAVGFGKDLATR